MAISLKYLRPIISTPSIILYTGISGNYLINYLFTAFERGRFPFS
jgi:hypothetical protein